MKFSQKQGSADVNHRCQGYYPTEGLYYLGERRQRKEHPTEEEHWCDKQGKIRVKAIKRGNKRGEEDGNRGEHYAS
jgi:hypothetical protein